MKQHPFRWDALVFGLVFLAVVGTWLTRTAGLLNAGQLAYVIAGALIAVGVAGILASLVKPGVATPATPAPPTSADAPTTDATSSDEPPSPDGPEQPSSSSR